MPGKPGALADARVKSIWNSGYARAKPFYVATHSPNPEQQARNSAWRSVKFNTEYPVVGRLRNRNAVELGAGPFPAVNPAAATWFGKMIEVTFFDVSGRLNIIHLTPHTDLLWDDPNKRIIAFPHMRNGTCMPARVHTEASVTAAKAMYKEWHKRAPDCVIPTQPPLKSTYAIGTVDTLSYRSDKWIPKRNPHPLLKGSPEYLHQVDDNVFVRTSHESKKVPLSIGGQRRQVDVPYVIIIEGGRLDATQAGIIH